MKPTLHRFESMKSLHWLVAESSQLQQRELSTTTNGYAYLVTPPVDLCRARSFEDIPLLTCHISSQSAL
jgi:hypothetical protein